MTIVVVVVVVVKGDVIRSYTETTVGNKNKLMVGLLYFCKLNECIDSYKSSNQCIFVKKK